MSLFGDIFNGVGSLVGIGSAVAGAAGTAANTNALSAEQKQDLTSARDTAVSNLQPYTTSGAGAQNKLSDLLGLNGQDAATKAMSTFQTDPGYGFQVQQGLKAIDQGAAARGMLNSGSTVQAEQTFGNNLADQSFGTYINRLSGLASQGLTATNYADQAGLDTAARLAGVTQNQLSTLNGDINGAAANAYSLQKNGSLSSLGNLFGSTATGATGTSSFAGVDGTQVAAAGGTNPWASLSLLAAGA
jgi:hypothetical protein